MRRHLKSPWLWNLVYVILIDLHMNAYFKKEYRTKTSCMNNGLYFISSHSRIWLLLTIISTTKFQMQRLHWLCWPAVGKEHLETAAWGCRISYYDTNPEKERGVGQLQQQAVTPSCSSSCSSCLYWKVQILHPEASSGYEFLQPSPICLDSTWLLLQNWMLSLNIDTMLIVQYILLLKGVYLLAIICQVWSILKTQCNDRRDHNIF